MATWDKLDDGQWDEALRDCPSACFFHTRGWATSLARWDGRFRAECHGATAPDGARVLLPVLARKGVLRVGPLARGVSMLPGVYGGPVVQGRPMNADDWPAALALLSELPFGRMELRSSPINPIPRELVERMPKTSSKTTHLLRLDDLAEDLISGYRESCRRAVRKALRAELRYEPLTTREERDAYYELYLDSVRRWKNVAGNVVLPRSLFESLALWPGVEFRGVRTRVGELAAGGVFLFWGRHTVYWHGAMLERLADARPANLLHHAVIDECRRRGFALYDLNPSAGIEGVERFKESFGAERVEVTLFGWRDRGQRAELARCATLAT